MARWGMNSLKDLPFQELHALLACLEHYDKSGRDEAAQWREAVFAEIRRRFVVLDESTKTMEAARAARDAASTS